MNKTYMPNFRASERGTEARSPSGALDARSNLDSYHQDADTWARRMVEVIIAISTRWRLDNTNASTTVFGEGAPSRTMGGSINQERGNNAYPGSAAICASCCNEVTNNAVAIRGPIRTPVNSPSSWQSLGRSQRAKRQFL